MHLLSPGPIKIPARSNHVNRHLKLEPINILVSSEEKYKFKVSFSASLHYIYLITLVTSYFADLYYSVLTGCYF